MRLLEPQGRVCLRLAAAGDVALIGAARRRASRNGSGAVLNALAPMFSGADLVFANLEMPLGAPRWTRTGRNDDYWHDASVPSALHEAGVDVVSLANNHIMDCGREGLTATLECCAAEGLGTAGAGFTLAGARMPWRCEVNGVRVVVLAYGAAAKSDRAAVTNPGVAPLEPALIAADMQRWRRDADLLVVSVHWGSMYVDYPPPRVLELASMLEKWGADVVIGHHPHVAQGYRRIGRTLTLFSVGDAVFGTGSGEVTSPKWSDVRRQTGVFTVLCAESPGLEYVPLRLDDDGVPEPLDPPAAAKSVERVARLASELQIGLDRYGDVGSPGTELEFAL